MIKLVRYRAKALAQYMEALRADGRVGFSRLTRTEAGLQSALQSAPVCHRRLLNREER